MSPVMEQAFARASQLSEDDQELFATMMLIEMDSGPGWAYNFASPETVEILTRMAHRLLAKPLHETGRSPRIPGFLDLYEFLHRVKQRQGMYLGTGRLNELEIICYGYSIALDAHQIEEVGTDFWVEFSSWLCQKYEWAGNGRWSDEIVRNAGSEQAGIDHFFELMDEYKHEWRARTLSHLSLPNWAGDTVEPQ